MPKWETELYAARSGKKTRPITLSDLKAGSRNSPEVARFLELLINLFDELPTKLSKDPAPASHTMPELLQLVPRLPMHLRPIIVSPAHLKAISMAIELNQIPHSTGHSS